MPPYKDATQEEVTNALERSAQAFNAYKKLSLKRRAHFLESIACEIEAASELLIAAAHRETNLDMARLKIELTRTIFQLTSYAEACEKGSWLDIRIDTAIADRNPPKPHLRKTGEPLGPVVVFGASNFPFAYSTAGGDTTSALAAGCTVILKAHPAHAETSELVANAIAKAAAANELPGDVFIHLHGAAFEVGRALVQHPAAAAVAFTGSLEGGRALFDLANSRPVPIPVFAEMGSVNPVFLLPQKLEQEGEAIAKMYATSITQSAGQFCTNPGLLVGIESDALESFKNSLASKIGVTPPGRMLHQGIAKNFQHKRAAALEVAGVSVVGTLSCPVGRDESIPTLAAVPATVFLKNKQLASEVFGPYSLLVTCEDIDQMKEVAKALEGQLTCTILAAPEEFLIASELVDELKRKAGRLIFNGVPTGVEVALAMHHGGPYPATTDSRFTAVGADAIKRFSRPVCYQDFPEGLLQDELKDANPLGIWRTVNGELTNRSISQTS